MKVIAHDTKINQTDKPFGNYFFANFSRDAEIISAVSAGARGKVPIKITIEWQGGLAMEKDEEQTLTVIIIKTNNLAVHAAIVEMINFT